MPPSDYGSYRRRRSRLAARGLGRPHATHRAGQAQSYCNQAVSAPINRSLTRNARRWRDEALILEFFGISIPVVRIAGGMLVTAMGWKLLSEGAGSNHEPLHDAADVGAANDSFYPLTLPLTVGPGAISVALTIG